MRLYPNHVKPIQLHPEVLAQAFHHMLTERGINESALETMINQFVAEQDRDECLPLQTVKRLILKKCLSGEKIDLTTFTIGVQIIQMQPVSESYN